MQKHQWRQHGIGHYKSRPNGPNGTQVGIIGAESVLYNSLLDRLPDHTDDTTPETAPAPALNVMFEAYPDVPEPSTHTEVADTYSEDDETFTANTINRVVNRYINETSVAETTDHDDPKKSLELLKSMDPTPVILTPDNNTHNTDNNIAFTFDIDNSNEQDDSTAKPMKLKMKLAQAYLKEVKEEREREEKVGKTHEGRDSFDTNIAIDHIEENLGDIKLSKHTMITSVETSTNVNNNNIATNSINDVATTISTRERECVECVCKACGNKCSVSDPYNFSCQHCNVKYTSLPTHMIADPLQCIGCLRVFQHKPAMKEHQSSDDKERPFICCKCGYEFKQKAHLQKHQWRIHRRKLEPDPNVKEAEAILKAVNEMSSIPDVPESPGPLEHVTSFKPEVVSSPGPEQRIGNLENFEGSAPLDLSPCKMYGSANSITAWVHQVETARTPIIPDISILKKPMDADDIKAHLPKEPLKLSQLQDDKVSVTIQILEPPTATKTWLKETINHQPIAVKSKPFQVATTPLTWRSSPPTDDNPLLNQKLVFVEDLSSRMTPPVHIDSGLDSRVYKRARTELQGVASVLQSPDTTQTHPADLSIKINQKLDFSPPSPPLNLSSKHSNDVPFDYTITRSELITGQLRRLRNQDERSGI